jgi:hypothetical protein
MSSSSEPASAAPAPAAAASAAAASAAPAAPAPAAAASAAVVAAPASSSSSSSSSSIPSLSVQARNIINRRFENKRNLNSLIISLFQRSYEPSANEAELSRRENVSTSTQGKWSIPPPILEGGLFKDYKGFINIPEILASKTGTDTEGHILYRLSSSYCYATGAYLLNDRGNIITGMNGPRSEIEHIVPWRTMITVCGDLADGPNQPTHGIFKDIVEIAAASQNTLLAFEAKVKQMKGDFSPLFSYAQTQDEREILVQMNQPHVQMNPYILFGLLINIKRCIIHGMWYSIRLWNQIKSNYILFKLTDVDGILKFSPSKSRIELLTDIMLCHFYKADGSVYETFDVYRSNQYERTGRINSLLQDAPKLHKGMRYGKNSGHYYAYGTMCTGQKIDRQSEFDFIKQLAENYGTIDVAKGVIINNTIRVCRYLCYNLNLYLYHRVAFNSKRRLNDPSGRGEDGSRPNKRYRKDAHKSDAGAAGADSPSKDQSSPPVPPSGPYSSSPEAVAEEEDIDEMKETRRQYWETYISNPTAAFSTPKRGRGGRRIITKKKKKRKKKTKRKRKTRRRKKKRKTIKKRRSRRKR